MPSSFDALHEETRSLTLLEPSTPPRCTPRTVFASLAGIILPVLLVVLAF